jgi:hypothetical protein
LMMSTDNVSAELLLKITALETQCEILFSVNIHVINMKRSLNTGW